MNIIRIEHCIKKPGFVHGGRTFTIILNQKGLYVFYLGKALDESIRSRDPFANAIADRIIRRMKESLEIKLIKAEEHILKQDFDALAKEKKNFFFPSGAMVNLEYKKHYDNTIEMNITWGKIKLILYADSYYENKILAIVNNLKSNYNIHQEKR